MPLHDREEWRALLQSAMEATDSFTAMELGAGWGPWLVAGAKAAERRGIGKINLIGVEAARSHFEFLRSHLADNGLESAQHKLFQAAVGADDATARFPKLKNPSAEWGTAAILNGHHLTASYERIPSISIDRLLADSPLVDLLHCDIQGAELDVLRHSIKTLRTRVRRLVIGTHSRGIEDGLLNLLAAEGWVLEAEKPCFVKQHGKAIDLIEDGVQVWHASR
jgi:FkbM family methyltransferase